MKLSAQLQKRLAAYGANLEGMLDAIENTQRHRAIGRKLGSERNKQRAKDCREKWRSKAARLREERPYLTLDQLATQVYEWCRTSGIKMLNGQHYKLRTIHDDLRKQFPELV